MLSTLFVRLFSTSDTMMLVTPARTIAMKIATQQSQQKSHPSPPPSPRIHSHHLLVWLQAYSWLMSAVDEAMDCATQELNSRQAQTDL